MKARRLIRPFAAAAGLLLFAVSLWVLYLELGRFPTEQITGAVTEIPRSALAAAAGLLLVSYLMTALSEALTAAYGGLALGPGRATTTALIVVGISNSVSFGLLTGTALRDRLYSRRGLSGYDTAKAQAFSTLGYWLGYAVLLAVGLLIFPWGSTGVSPTPPRLAAAALLLSVTAYLLATMITRSGIRLGAVKLRTPRPAIAAAQLTAGTADWFAAALLLFALLPAEFSFSTFLLLFCLATGVGVLSRLPGGVVVFDAAFLAAYTTLGGVAPGATPSIVAALLLYRLIYFALPLLLGLALLARRELTLPIRHSPEQPRRRLTGALPSVATLLVFVTGALLLFSGATPAIAGRMAVIRRLLPLSVVELSHLLAAAFGVSLLFLARGVQRRDRIALRRTATLLILAALLSLARGGAYESAILFLLILGALRSLRGSFGRRSGGLFGHLSYRWVFAILLVIMATAWLTIFANRPVALTRYLWLEVRPEAAAARSLRALGAAVAVAASVFLFRASRTVFRRPQGAAGRAEAAGAAESSAAVRGAEERSETSSGEAAGGDLLHPWLREVLKQSSSCYPNLLLLGDKEIFPGEQRDSFIMYTTVGGSRVAMGDPVGPPERRRELVWRFKEEGDRLAYRTIFYEVERESVPIYREIGLTALPLGREGVVELDSFSLRGRSNHDLRNAVNRMSRDGWEVAILEPEALPAILQQLKGVSDSWLRSKGARERGFAVGWFDPAYLGHFPVAVVRRGEEIIAFANIWESGDRREASVDLMRHTEEAPTQTMDFLFVELINRAKERGFARFNLGLAPLAGMEEEELAPLWRRLSGFLYRHGEQFYSFQGLREYKEKFHPRWETKYLVLPPGPGVPAGLLDLLRLSTRRTGGDSPAPPVESTPIASA